MQVNFENEIKTIHMGDKGHNLISVERANEIISELNKNDCKAVIILGNEKVFSAGLNLNNIHKKSNSPQLNIEQNSKGLVGKFLNILPFSLTDAQKRVLKEIESDIVKAEPMSRLLQGDVGSGKTVIAISALLTACLLYTSPSPRDVEESRMPSSA